MARNLPYTSIQRLCSPEWIAKTYSEYMMDCAASQLDLIDSILNVSDDNALTGYIDAQTKAFDNAFDAVLEILNENDGIIRDYDNVPFTNLSDPKAIEALDTILTDPDGEQYQRISHALNDLNGMNLSFDVTLNNVLTDPGHYSFKELIDEYPLEVFLQGSEIINSRMATLIDTASSNLNIHKNTMIALDHHSMKLTDLIKGISFDINGIRVPSLRQYTFSGVEASLLKRYTAEDLIEQLKSSASSCIAWGIGFAAQSQTTLSDKLSYFEAQIKSYISDFTATFASSVNTVRARIASCGESIADFFSISADELGWTKLFNDTLESADETDVYSYTGASPWSAFSCKGAIGIGEAVVKTTGAIVGGVFAGAFEVIKRVASKFKPFLKALTNNPIDIGVCDSADDSYTISGFDFHAENQKIEFDFTGDGTDIDDPIAVLESKIGKWISIDTYAGSIQFCVTDVERMPYARTVYYSYRLKPKCLNYRKLIEFSLVEKVYPSSQPITFDPTLIRIKTLSTNGAAYAIHWANFLTSNDAYAEDDEEEAYVYMGFHVALVLLKQLCTVTASEIYDWYSSNKHPDANEIYNLKGRIWNNELSTPGYEFTSLMPFENKNCYFYTGTMPDDLHDYMVPSGVTNLDFLKIASGYNSVGQSVIFDLVATSNMYGKTLQQVTTPFDNSYFFSMSEGIGCLIFAFIIQQMDKVWFPAEYLYLPYYNNSWSMPSGRYKIKTDAQNANILNIIVSATILIIGAIALIVVGKKLLKLYRRNRIMTLRGQIGPLDQKMWNNQPLTRAEKKQYYRWSRKIDKLSSVASGLAGSGSSLANVKEGISKLSSLVVANSPALQDLGISSSIPRSINSNTDLNNTEVRQSVSDTQNEVQRVYRKITGSNS